MTQYGPHAHQQYVNAEPHSQPSGHIEDPGMGLKLVLG
jgi:hypothetical protein